VAPKLDLHKLCIFVGSRVTILLLADYFKSFLYNRFNSLQCDVALLVLVLLFFFGVHLLQLNCEKKRLANSQFVKDAVLGGQIKAVDDLKRSRCKLTVTEFNQLQCFAQDVLGLLNKNGLTADLFVLLAEVFHRIVLVSLLAKPL